MTMLVKKAFISSEFIPSVSLCPLPWAFLFSRVLRKKDFPIKRKRLQRGYAAVFVLIFQFRWLSRFLQVLSIRLDHMLIPIE